jgi:hypothetical protein
MATYNVSIRLRRDTAANWTGTNPVLALGEAGVETNTRLMKVGDGATAWASLGYVTARADDIPEIDVIETNISSLSASKISISDVGIYQKALVTDSSDARTITGVTIDATDILIWTGYTTRPTNMGVNDIWLGPPGAAVSAKVADYTLVLNDGGTVITMSDTAEQDVIIPANASVAFPIGTMVNVVRLGTGNVRIVGATGVTVNGTSAGAVSISTRWQGAQALKIATNEWVVSGSLV